VTWQLKLGDCVSGMLAVADGSVDVGIHDPPYSEHVHSKSRRGLTVTHRGGATDEISERRELGFEHIDDATMAAVSVQFARICRRWTLVFCDVESSQRWAAHLENAGLEYLRTAAWVKLGGAPQFTGDRPAVGFEAIVCAHPPGRKRWNGGGKAGIYAVPTAIDRDRSGLDYRQHTTQKPVALMEALIRDFTDPGELVLDAFSGVGTTGVAAIRLGRRFIGWERDPKYHAVAMKRLSAAREQLRMFDPPAAGTRRETTSTETTTNQGDEHDDVRASAGFAEEGPSRGARGLEPSGHVAGTADARRALEDDPAVHLHHAGGRVPRAVGGEPAGHAGRGLVREVAAKPRRVTVLDEHGREVGP